MSNVSLSPSLVPSRRRSRQEDLTLPAILEFQWPSAAIVNAPIPRSARGVVWMIASMVAALIAATALIPDRPGGDCQGNSDFAVANDRGAATGNRDRTLDQRA